MNLVLVFILAALSVGAQFARFNAVTGKLDLTGVYIQSGSGAPTSNCSVGLDYYFRTDATAGQNLYFCTTTNNWTQMATGGTLSSPYISSGGLYYGPLWPMTPPVLGDFTWVNQSTATATSLPGGAILLDTQAAAGVSLNGLFKSAPSTPYTIEAAVVFRFRSAAGAVRCGLGFRESSTGKITGMGTRVPPEISYNSWYNPTSYQADANNYSIGTTQQVLLWLKITNDNTNLTYSWGATPYSYLQNTTQAKAAFFTTGPDQVGFYCDSNSSSTVQSMVLLSWKQS